MSCTDEASGGDRRPAVGGAGAGGGRQGESASGPEASDDRRNLYPLIFLGQVHGLNLSDPVAGAKAPIKPWSSRLHLSPYAESGTDDSMIITVPFTSPVTIKSILLNPGTGDFAPRRIRLFVNRVNGLDFDDVEAASAVSSSDGELTRPPELAPDAQGVASLPMGAMRAATRHGATGDVRSGKPQADFALLEGVAGITEYPLGAARFSNVNSISLVISDATAGDVCRLYYLGFRGLALQIPVPPGERLDIPAATGADAPVPGVRESAARQSDVR